MSIHNYHSLQKTLDQAIGKIGLDKTVILLESFMNQTTLSMDETEKGKLLIHLLISNAIRIYDLKDVDFFNSKIKEYKEARMACYYILKKYTDWSYAKISQVFNAGERNVRYFIEKIEECFQLPDYNKDFLIRFDKLENKFIEVLSKIS